MYNSNLISLIFPFSLILYMVKVINIDSSGVSVSCHNFIWYLIYFISTLQFILFSLSHWYLWLPLPLDSLLLFVLECLVFLVVLQLHQMFWLVSYFHQYSHHPQFYRIYTHGMVVEVIFLVSIIYYHFISRFLHSPFLLLSVLCLQKSQKRWVVCCVFSVKSMSFHVKC